MASHKFQPRPIPPEAEQERARIRAFLAAELKDYPRSKRAKSWNGYDREFSKKLGAAGFLGMTWPKKYGGHEKSAFARYVVAEELLAHGAPVAAHLIADRQSGPLVLNFGTEAQKEKYVPGICRGETSFCIGMSEPDSGSDLASIRSRARRNDKGGWTVNGRKVWTTIAHHSQYMIALLRTEEGSERQAGLSQFVIDLKTPGIIIRPIRDVSGSEHFNEVTFDNVEIGADTLLGTEGQGWNQVMAELAFERSGPERILTSIELLYALIDIAGKNPAPKLAAQIGRLTAKLATFRQMSISVTALLEAKENPSWEASVVKDLGTSFEQELPEILQGLIDEEPSVESGSEYAQALAYIMQVVPSFTLRGGTREIIHGIIARGLGLR
jgi:hypothetical protein